MALRRPGPVAAARDPHALAEWALAAAFVLAYTLGAGYYLAHHTDSTFPHWDSFTTGTSIAAQFLLMRKRLENWWLWLLVDIIYVPILWVKHLYPTSLLYALYLGLAAYGYWEWRRDMRSKHSGGLVIFGVQRISITGPESAGKSTLAAQLAAHYGTGCGTRARPRLLGR
ncbi:MAG: nicotinamide riboside transporter PnuC [Hymenobacter sp.]